MDRYGIILAGGSGSRMYPTTKVVSKHLLPINDKPMIFYPLSTLMLAGIRNILVITRPADLDSYEQLLGDGRQWGLTIRYAEQPQPNGVAEALIISEKFLDGRPSALILGDNIFYGHLLKQKLVNANAERSGACIFCYRVNDPKNYGVVHLDANGKAIDIVEKPAEPMSNYAVTGLYFFDENAPLYARGIASSQRGELEITDLNRIYLEQKEMKTEILHRGFAWFDAGTPENFQSANSFVQTIEKRQGLKIACLEEVAFRENWITSSQLSELIGKLPNCEYKNYLSNLTNDGLLYL